MLAVTVAPTAEVGLVEIWLDIARDKPQAADRMIDRFHSRRVDGISLMFMSGVSVFHFGFPKR
jgi:hypothetical protein